MDKKQKSLKFTALIIVMVFVSVLAVFAIAKASTDLNAPGSPLATGQTLEDIYQMLNAGTLAGSHNLYPSGSSITGTMHTLDDIYNIIPTNDKICSGTNAGTALCQIGPACGTGVYCQVNYWCGQDGMCHNNCQTGSDCPTGYCGTYNYGLCTDGSKGSNCAQDSECNSLGCGSDHICGGVGAGCIVGGTPTNSKCVHGNCGPDGTCGSGGTTCNGNGDCVYNNCASNHVCGDNGASCNNYNSYNSYCKSGLVCDFGSCTDYKLGSPCYGSEFCSGACVGSLNSYCGQVTNENFCGGGGAICDNSNAYCAPGDFCNLLSIDNMGYSYCLGTSGDPGSGCSLNSDCKYGNCDTGTEICGDNNTTCASNSQCATNYCEPHFHVCSDKTTGTQCWINSECTYSNCGTDHKCGSNGAYCANGNQCIGGYCYNNACTDGRLGSGCASDDDCYMAYYYTGICGTDHVCGGVGAICWDGGNDDCIHNNCGGGNYCGGYFATCTLGSDCISGWCSTDAVSGCKDSGDLGTNCGQNSECDSTQHLVCKTGTCIGVAGASCGADSDCASGHCVNDVCTNSYPGDPCGTNDDCVYSNCGLDNICGSTGASCVNGGDCVAVTGCSGGICD
jgi:hypothetical protein